MKKETKASDLEVEIAKLKALLKETRKTNKRLKKQNRRQQQVGYLSRGIRFPTMWHVRPAKAQISLRTRTVESEVA